MLGIKLILSAKFKQLRFWTIILLDQNLLAVWIDKMKHRKLDSYHRILVLNSCICWFCILYVYLNTTLFEVKKHYLHISWMVDSHGSSTYSWVEFRQKPGWEELGLWKLAFGLTINACNTWLISDLSHIKAVIRFLGN